MSNRPKILYAIQGTGNGHVARAREIIPILQEFGRVDVVLSGDQSDVSLPVKPCFRSKGLNFVYNKNGGISYLRSLLKNNLFQIIREIHQFPVHRYDVVINDFEFITAWACRLRKIPCYGLGHQASFYSAKVPRPAKRKWLGECILKYYAPVTHPLGFHFKAYDRRMYTPVIRSEIRQAPVINKGHFTVYLPAFGTKRILAVLGQISEVEWQVFSKRTQSEICVGNVRIRPIENEGFITSLVESAGILTSAGFETPAEALYLGKKLAVIPIRHQYEQHCNAAALTELGVPVFEDLDTDILNELRAWVLSGSTPAFIFPDQTREVIGELLNGRIGESWLY